MLRDVGIRLDLDIRDPGAFWSAGGGVAGEQVQLALQRFGGKPDPGFLLQWFTAAQVGSWNWQRWRDAEYDELVQRAAATPDGSTRDALYVAAQQRMEDSSAFVWLTHEVAASACRPWLRPAVLNNGEDWLLDRFSRF
jgi:peptide/nickel transport system substrate-binding protein